MAKIFENILNNARRKGITNQKSQEAITWMRQNVRKTATSSSRLIREESGNLVNSWTNVGAGQMYFAFYDPKHKATLPYYDKFPLIIPIERYRDGFLSLNLHYLPPLLRAKLLDALYDTITSETLSEKAKIQANYGTVVAASKMSMYKPCVKRYLGSHFRSRFIRLEPETWTAAVFLPVESFEKASKQQVWSDSRKKSK